MSPLPPHHSVAVVAATTGARAQQPPSPLPRTAHHPVHAHLGSHPHPHHLQCGHCGLRCGLRCAPAEALPQATAETSPTHTSTHAPPAATHAPSAPKSLRAVVVSDCFDGGNIIMDKQEPNSSGEVEVIRLRIKPDPYTDGTDFKTHSQWFYFRASNVRGRACRFEILNGDKVSYPEAWERYNTCMSQDGRTWTRVATTSYSEETGVLSWEITPESDTVWFAYFEPYSYEQHMQLIGKCAAHPAADVSTLGTTLDGRMLDLVTVGHGPLKVWVIARQHPGEIMAEWFAEGMLLRLLEEASLQEQATFYIVPNMNPDGSVRGHLRTNAGGANLNREWGNSGNYVAPTLERSPEVYHVLAAMESVGVDLFMDIHGDEEEEGNFFAGADGIPGFTPRLAHLLKEFTAAMLKASKDFQTEVGYDAEPPGEANMAVATNVVCQRFDCLGVTFEQPFKDTWNNPGPLGWTGRRAAQLGADTLTAIADILPALRSGAPAVSIAAAAT